MTRTGTIHEPIKCGNTKCPWTGTWKDLKPPPPNFEPMVVVMASGKTIQTTGHVCPVCGGSGFFQTDPDLVERMARNDNG